LDEQYKDSVPGDPTFRYGVPVPQPMIMNFSINPGGISDDVVNKKDEAMEVLERKVKGDGSKEKRKKSKPKSGVI
jgi:hypothetical protein